MSFQTDLMLVLPEILLLVSAAVLLIVEARCGACAAGSIHRLTQVALLGVLFAVLHQVAMPPSRAFGDMVQVDAVSSLLKVVAVLVALAVVVYSRQYAVDRGIGRGELYALTVLSLLGQFVIISAGNLLVLYLGIELMTLSLYALVALRRDDSRSVEAAMKYFVLGALASGFLLYGMSMVYGATGSLDIVDIVRAIGSGMVSRPVLVFGLVFLVAGIAFKFGAAPFHMWVPDVYQGAPTVGTVLIAAGPKLAAFALAFRLLAEGLPVASADWSQMVLVLAVVSVAIGNIAAVAQTNLKRMLAFSGIAQIGFLLLGMAGSWNPGMAGGSLLEAVAEGFSSSLFYAVTYALTTVGTFGLMMLLARSGHECEEIADLRGLGRSRPWMALMMLLMMFSLAGIPPLVGFHAKLAVLEPLISAGHVGVAVFAVLMSLIGAFYYLRVVKVMYFEESSAHGTDHAEAASSALVVPFPAVATDARVLMMVNGGLVLVLGILPGPLMDWCVRAVRLALS